MKSFFLLINFTQIKIIKFANIKEKYIVIQFEKGFIISSEQKKSSLLQSLYFILKFLQKISLKSILGLIGCSPST